MTTFMNSSKPYAVSFCHEVITRPRHEEDAEGDRRTDNDETFQTKVGIVIQPDHDSGVLSVSFPSASCVNRRSWDSSPFASRKRECLWARCQHATTAGMEFGNQEIWKHTWTITFLPPIFDYLLRLEICCQALRGVVCCVKGVYAFF